MHQLLVLLLAVELRPGPGQHFPQLIMVNRLQEIIKRTQPQRVPRIFELPVAADEDEEQLRILRQQCLHQGNTVNDRHPDIADDNLRGIRLNEFQRGFTVARFPYDGQTQFLPRYGYP
ncbi:hypothetical protein D3C73_998580 [compost metagenome]